MKYIVAVIAAGAFAISAPTALAADAAQALQQMQQQVRQAATVPATARAAAVDKLLGQMRASPVAMARAPAGLSPAQMSKLNALRSKIAARPQAAASVMPEWQAFMSDKSMKGKDVNAMVMYALQQSVSDAQRDKKAFLDKLRRHNDMAKALGDHMKELNKKAASLPPGPKRSKLEAEIKATEFKLRKAKDDAQLASVDLQNMLQKQQQTLQMLSNISKQMHETALSIIRKIGG